MKALFFIIFFIVFISCQSAPKKHDSKNSTKVVLISIDGFRPDFYLNEDFNAPTLKKLAKTGRYARGMISVFPSVTYPNHTTLVTGKYPAEHGILTNGKFDWEKGATSEWYWDSTEIKTDTIWDLLHEHELTTAAIHWPVTQFANIDYLIPEIFQMPPWHKEESFDLVVKYSTRNLPLEINKNLGLAPYTNMRDADSWGTKAFQYIFEKYQPDFSAFHLTLTDHYQHESGRDSEMVKHAVNWIDNKIDLIVRSLDQKSCLMIVGDHGFMDFTKEIHVNKLFRDQGWILYDDEQNKLISWKVLAQKWGGQAAIYVKDRSLTKKVISLLKRHQKLGYEFIDQQKLKELKTYPEAIAAISAKDGVSIGNNFSGELITINQKVKGQHGHLPEQKKLHAGFIAYNCGQGTGELKTLIKNTQITPTILSQFGIVPEGFTESVIDL